jgi:hypothetical protein
MNEEKKSVSRLARTAKQAKTFGLWVLGLGVYVGILATIAGVLIWCVGAGVMSVKWAVGLATLIASWVHWMVVSTNA